MNRKDREIKDESEHIDILRNGKIVTISLCRKNEPYIVTLDYGYDEAKKCLYFHCAKKGLKINFLLDNSQVCATIIEDLGYVDGRCEHKFRSLVFWGTMMVVENLEEKKHGMIVLLNHLEENPEKLKKRLLSKDTAYQKFAVLRLDITEISGKQIL
jgi:nitroimidazol reductase NimA-like FMN-containing flavoprotein (pyridoxamine 5'-phosphate oxidase superfamily)